MDHLITIISKNPCQICLESDDSKFIQLECNHIFHDECIRRWSYTHNSCPHCRQQIYKELYFIQLQILFNLKFVSVDHDITLIHDDSNFVTFSLNGVLDTAPGRTIRQFSDWQHVARRIAIKTKCNVEIIIINNITDRIHVMEDRIYVGWAMMWEELTT